jgi:hypothetical protein
MLKRQSEEAYATLPQHLQQAEKRRQAAVPTAHPLYYHIWYKTFPSLGVLPTPPTSPPDWPRSGSIVPALARIHLDDDTSSDGGMTF